MQNLHDGLAYVLPWRSTPHVHFPLAFLAGISMSFVILTQVSAHSDHTLMTTPTELCVVALHFYGVSGRDILMEGEKVCV